MPGGRKQYVYHPEWRALQQSNKFNKLVVFGEVLPAIRSAVAGDMAGSGLSRERVVATVVWLLDNTFIRIGNREYTRANHSYGLTTLRNKHVEVSGNQVLFEFQGKGGLWRSVCVEDRRVARIIRQCIELPGYELFQYLDEAGQRRTVESRDVNDYLKAVSGDDFTAKDFRTWGGTVLAGKTLYQLGPFDGEPAARKNVVMAVKAAAQVLGNTPSICRQYYIHPSLLDAYQSGRLVPYFERIYRKYEGKDLPLDLDEYAAWSLIKDEPLEAAAEPVVIAA